MKILAIETSCDETSTAIVENGRKIITNIVASSKDLHTKTGGIIPEVAAREQIKCMIPVLEEALNVIPNSFRNPSGMLKQVQHDKILNNIDAIAVTIGPGLVGSLLVGVETAKTIAFVTGKPIIPVNHIFAHIYANWLHLPQPTTHNLQPTTHNLQPAFPALALVVSGGHTELFLMQSHEEIKWIGGTLDDASGECFDKTARLLGLGYPGGPVIAAAAEEYRIKNQELRIKNEIKLPRPMIDSKDFNFSFSGLKTAVLRETDRLKSLRKLNEDTINQLSYELQESITDVLVVKTLKAAQKYKVKSILLGGGVAANNRLTEKLKFEICNLKFVISLYIPPPTLCTDNAAYIASYAYFHNHPIPWQNINARPDLEVEV